MKKCLFIFNPNTGGGRLKNKLMEIICLLANAGYKISMRPTNAPGSAKQISEDEGHLHDILVCCGGDGTLNEVVHGLLSKEKRPVLGYIPGGTTNDFASSLGIPKSDMIKAAIRIVCPKEIFSFDVGKFNSRVFNYVAAFGAFTDVSYTTPQAFKNLLGYVAYLIEGVQHLPDIKPIHAKIITDNGVLEEDFLFGMVANSTSVGGFKLAKNSQVSLNDGFFEMILVRPPHNIADFHGLSNAIITRNFSSPWLEVQSVRTAEIITESPISWTLDGEFGGEHTISNIEVEHKALEIFK